MSSKQRGSLPGFTDLGFAKVDLDRQQRCGNAEVIFGEGKTAQQIISISQVLHDAGQPILVTRSNLEVYEEFKTRFPKAVWHEQSSIITGQPLKLIKKKKIDIAICAAGTTDLRVAEEAALCAQFWGLNVQRHYDVGVAGLHRLLNSMDAIKTARVVIAVAGKEGALPSVMGGLLSQPIIAVPTSVGYGVGQGGQAALHGMLTSCASGLTVVNIDNGFGAAYAAFRIIKGS